MASWSGVRSRVHVHVAGGDAGHPEALGQLGEQLVAAAVVAPVGTLQLDAEAVGPGGEQAAGHRGLRVLGPLDASGHGAVAGTAGQADEPLGVTLDVRERDARSCRAGPAWAGGRP